MQSPITHDQLVEICRVMDMNKDGLVDLNEFLETFRLVDQDLHRNTLAHKITNDESLFCNNGKEINNKTVSPISTSPINMNIEDIKIKENRNNTLSDDLSQQEYPKKRLRRESLGIDKGDYNWEYTRTLAELQCQAADCNESENNAESKQNNKDLLPTEDKL